MLKLKLHWQILIAMALAVFIGWLTGADGELLGVRVVGAFAFVGTLFLNALKMLIVPLIMSSIIVGVAGIGSSGDLGRLGGKTLVFYLSSSLLAILLGLVLVNLLQPGVVDGEPAGPMLALEETVTLPDSVGQADSGTLTDIFLRMVPTNVIQAAANGKMLGLIFFSLLFGYFLSRVDHSAGEPLYNFWNGVFQVMMRITEWVMKFAPIGVFGLVAETVSQTGFGAAGP
ncbi:MAG: cation:dicarboxylase symporter family transporter, partial [Gammaproteobacteria bacterium]